MPITGLAALFYSAQTPELRAFFRDRLNFPTTNAGGGWLLFDIPTADLGVRPTDPHHPHQPPPNTAAISFFCENLQATVADLHSKGV
jgi:hypothetical protein